MGGNLALLAVLFAAALPGDPARRAVLAALGVAPERCAVFEDSIAGATAGRAARMFVIAVPEGAPEGRGFEAVAHAIAHWGVLLEQEKARRGT